MIKSNQKAIANLLTKQLFLFSDAQSQAKGYRMPVRQVEKKFKPKRPVQFYQGRALIYLNKQGLFTPTLLTAHLTVPMFYLAYLIKNNPWYLTFPAALPIMGFIQIFCNIFIKQKVFFRYISQKKDNKYQIERIYLTEDGEMAQVWLANKLRRKLKNTEDDIMFQIKDLKTPPVGDNQLPLKGTLFPQKFNDMKFPLPWQYGWYKYDMNRENYIIPKNYEYANWQLLIPVMKGVQIDTSQCPKTPIPIDELRKMPTLEDAIKEVQVKKREQAQWQKKNGKISYSADEDI